MISRRYCAIERKSKRFRGFLVAGILTLLALGALAGCGQPTTATQQYALARAQPTPLPTVHVAGVVDRVQFTKPEELCMPTFIAGVAEVVVGAHGDARWNTSNGKRPPIATGGEIMRQGYFIYTPVMFSSFTSLRVHSLLPGEAYMTIGGQVGQDSYRMDGYPQLQGIGGHYILVITTPAPRKGMTPADTLLISYAFPIDANGKVIIQQAGDPNEPGPGVPQPEISVALTDLKAMLARCAA
jgi:hypothetical protein